MYICVLFTSNNFHFGGSQLLEGWARTREQTNHPVKLATSYLVVGGWKESRGASTSTPKARWQFSRDPKHWTNSAYEVADAAYQVAKTTAKSSAYEVADAAYQVAKTTTRSSAYEVADAAYQVLVSERKIWSSKKNLKSIMTRGSLSYETRKRHGNCNMKKWARRHSTLNRPRCLLSWNATFTGNSNHKFDCGIDVPHFWQ